MEGKTPSMKASQADRWFGALTRVMEIGVVLLAPDQDLDFANAPACSLLGYDSCEDLRPHWPEFRRLLQPALDRTCEGNAAGTPLDLEVASGGRTRKLRFELYLLEEQACEGFLVLIKDRDMLDGLEDELALAIQMRGLTRFYMEVVHDLKAPLNAMVINLELLKDTIRADGDPQHYERQRRYIDVLGEEVLRLNRSLTSLLTQTPRLSETPQRFDLRELVQELALLLGPQAKAQQVEVQTTLPDHPMPIVGRRDRLKQGVLNVAINALEAMPEGGLLGLALARDGDTARLAVRDTGPGIPPEIVDRIYAMHFTTKSGGTGIGLYVARSVVLAQLGTIAIDTAAGAGTTVHITLPLAPPE